MIVVALFLLLFVNYIFVADMEEKYKRYIYIGLLAIICLSVLFYFFFK